MKRIIKFRGKDIKTGEFVFGDLETRPREDFMVIHQYHEDGSYKSQVKVDPDTVGQFTGLKDRDGKDIYEGDIIGVKAKSDDSTILHLVFFDDSEGRFKAGLNGTQDRHDFGCCGLDDERWTHSKTIISNIYDHPELLETEE